MLKIIGHQRNKKSSHNEIQLHPLGWKKILKLAISFYKDMKKLELIFALSGNVK